jgi:hypothetical protein
MFLDIKDEARRIVELVVLRIGFVDTGVGANADVLLLLTARRAEKVT